MEEQKKPQEQPKKGHGCLIAFLIFLFLILATIAGGYWLYKRITSGLTKQVDLNITYSQSDLDSLMNSVGLEIDPSQLCIDCELPSFTDPHAVDLTVTSQQATAFVNITNENMQVAKLGDTDIKFSEDKAEISTVLTYQGNTFPVYASGNISKATDTTISANLYDVKVGNISIPKSIQDYVETVLESMTNAKLSELGDTLRIDSVEFTSSGLHVVGLIPSKGE